VRSGSRSVAERKAMIDRGQALPLVAQAQQLGTRGIFDQSG
jgi:hypothetical protein